MEADAALGGTASAVVLYPERGEYLDGAVVHGDRDVGVDNAFWLAEDMEFFRGEEFGFCDFVEMK
jgi:hypothetical protein